MYRRLLRNVFDSNVCLDTLD